MKTATVLHWAHPGAAGLRTFETADAAIQGGEDPAALLTIGGVLVKWPGALGAAPDDAAVAVLEAAYDAEVSGRVTRHAEVIADAEGDNFVDKLRGATASQIRTFVAANVNNLADAKTFLAKLAVAVAYALQGGRDK